MTNVSAAEELAMACPAFASAFRQPTSRKRASWTFLNDVEDGDEEGRSTEELARQPSRKRLPKSISCPVIVRTEASISTMVPSAGLIPSESISNLSEGGLFIEDDDVTTEILTPTTTSLGEVKSKTTAVPTPEDCEDMDPDQYLKVVVEAMVGLKPKVKPSLSVTKNFFEEPTEQQLSCYNSDLVAMVRDNRLEDLRALHESGYPTLQTSNRFGESLIHMACRRGYTDVVAFLVREAGVSLRVRDDCGRTPFHDACWNPQPIFDVMDVLIEREPVLLFLSDKRGFTPFNYARQDHWQLWKQFIFDRRDQIVSTLKAETLSSVLGQ